MYYPKSRDHKLSRNIMIWCVNIKNHGGKTFQSSGTHAKYGPLAKIRGVKKKSQVLGTFSKNKKHGGLKNFKMKGSMFFVF